MSDLPYTAQRGRWSRWKCQETRQHYCSAHPLLCLRLRSLLDGGGTRAAMKGTSTCVFLDGSAVICNIVADRLGSAIRGVQDLMQKWDFLKGRLYVRREEVRKRERIYAAQKQEKRKILLPFDGAQLWLWDALSEIGRSRWFGLPLWNIWLSSNAFLFCCHKGTKTNSTLYKNAVLFSSCVGTLRSAIRLRCTYFVV